MRLTILSLQFKHVKIQNNLNKLLQNISDILYKTEKRIIYEEKSEIVLTEVQSSTIIKP